jgi:hypothetical protein
MHTLQSQPHWAHRHLHRHLHPHLHPHRLPSGVWLWAATLALPLAILLAGKVASAQAAPPQRPGSSDAHSLPDPTRPPLAMQLATTASHLTRQVARPDDAASAPLAAAAAAMPVLQGVQVPARGPATAMLDGRLVKVGDSVGNRVVSDIDSQGITLQGPLGSHRLSLLGGGRKQPAGSIVISRSASFSATHPGDTATGDQGSDLAPPTPSRQLDRQPERQPERRPPIRGNSGAGVNMDPQINEPGPAAGGISMSQRRTGTPPGNPPDTTTTAPPAPKNEPAPKDAGSSAGVATSATTTPRTTPRTTGATSAAGAPNHSPAAPPDNPVVLASKPRP